MKNSCFRFFDVYDVFDLLEIRNDPPCGGKVRDFLEHQKALRRMAAEETDKTPYKTGKKGLPPKSINNPREPATTTFY